MNTPRRTARDVFEEAFGEAGTVSFPTDGARPAYVVSLRGTSVLVQVLGKPAKLGSPSSGGEVPQGTQT